jgi:hypothetical protein
MTVVLVILAFNAGWMCASVLFYVVHHNRNDG